MLPNMKFYIASLVAVFMALGIGIYIGFTIDTESFVTVQQEKLIEIVESQFEKITKENQDLIKESDLLKFINKNQDSFVNESYQYMVKDQLKDKKIAIIETSPDYMVSSIGYDLENAGGLVLSLSQINTSDKEEIRAIADAIITGNSKALDRFIDMEKFSGLGDYNQSPDLIILGGGSLSQESSKVISLDREIIELAKAKDLDLLGVEKTYSKNSYMNKFKEYSITTVDNIDTKIGKIALVLAANNPGNYGVKGTSDSILPEFKILD